jgi:hypothetical protein
MSSPALHVTGAGMDLTLRVARLIEETQRANRFRCNRLD